MHIGPNYVGGGGMAITRAALQNIISPAYGLLLGGAARREAVAVALLNSCGMAVL